MNISNFNFVFVEYVLKCVACFYLIIVFISFKNIEITFRRYVYDCKLLKIVLLKNCLKLIFNIMGLCVHIYI